MSNHVPSAEAAPRVREVRRLVRHDAPTSAASFSARRLIHVVAEWGPDSCLDLTMGSHRGRRIVSFEQRGSAQPGWESDVAWAVEHVAELAGARKRAGQRSAPTWSSVHEVCAEVRRDAQPSSVGSRDPGPGEERRLPEPVGDTLKDLSGLMDECPSLLCRIRIAPASGLEVDMITEQMGREWPLSAPPFDDYLGRPVRARLLLGVASGELPARARAVARRLASRLVVRPLSATAALDAWTGEVSSLAGHAVPEALALALVRVPAAGNEPFAGFDTKAPQLVRRPMDPVPPKPEVPLRLGHATTSSGRRLDACMDVRDLLRHGFIEGMTGAGKSTLMAAIVRELTVQGYGCTVLAPHGQLVDQILSELPQQSDRTYVVRYGDPDLVAPINILTGGDGQVDRSIDMFIEMIQHMYDPKHEGIVGPRWRRWFGLLARGTHAALGDQASIMAATEIGTDVDRVKRLALALRGSHPELSKSLIDEIVKDRSNEAASLLAWCVSKLQPLLSTGVARAALGTGRNTIDPTDVLDHGKTMLVDLASPVVGETTARMIGALILQQYAMAMATGGADRKEHVILVDEGHLFQYGALPSLLAEGRKFGLGVVLATQHLGQLREDLAESLESNAGSFFTFRTGVSYAPRAAVRLGGWPVHDISRLPNLVAAASVSRGGTMSEPFTLTVDHHSRMKRTRARGAEAADRARDVERRSVRELIEPHRSAEQMTPARLDELLAPPDRAAGSEPSFTVKLVGFDQGRREDLERRLALLVEQDAGDLGPLMNELPSVVLDRVSRSRADRTAEVLGLAGAEVSIEVSQRTPSSPSSFLDEWLASRNKTHTRSSDDQAG